MPDVTLPLTDAERARQDRALRQMALILPAVRQFAEGIATRAETEAVDLSLWYAAMQRIAETDGAAELVKLLREHAAAIERDPEFPFKGWGGTEPAGSA